MSNGMGVGKSLSTERGLGDSRWAKKESEGTAASHREAVRGQLLGAEREWVEQPLRTEDDKGVHEYQGYIFKGDGKCVLRGKVEGNDIHKHRSASYRK